MKSDNPQQQYQALLADCVTDFARAEESARRLYSVIRAFEVDAGAERPNSASQQLHDLMKALGVWKASILKTWTMSHAEAARVVGATAESEQFPC